MADFKPGDKVRLDGFADELEVVPPPADTTWVRLPGGGVALRRTSALKMAVPPVDPRREVVARAEFKNDSNLVADDGRWDELSPRARQTYLAHADAILADLDVMGGPSLWRDRHEDLWVNPGTGDEWALVDAEHDGVSGATVRDLYGPLTRM